ncbi:hypothetical protein [Aquicella siphonis]|uniref:hypothetical protein n=1 Tax=Aquicella siphonis TaxID=254247 RepID=UPI0011DD70F0|nr:hypothetical protein [Aquicella siphonis]
MNGRDAQPAQDEAIPLLPPRQPEIINEKSNWLILASQITLGTIGLGAGILYYGPAQTCSVTPQCGKWLADLTSENTAVIIFTSGGLDFSAGAMFMGAQSAQATINYIKQQPTPCAKLGKSAIVILVAGTQSIPLLLASLNTSPALWQTLLTVGGSVPASFYGAINLIQTEIPYWMSKAGVLSSSLHHRIVDRCCPIGEAERQQWAMIAHYRRQHAVFLKQLDIQWHYIVSQMRALDPRDVQDPLLFLFQSAAPAQNHSWLASGVHHAGTLSGFLLAANFSSAFISNTFSTLKKFLPGLPLQIAASALLSLSQTYANMKLTIDGIHSIFDSLMDIFRGKPVNSVAFQLRPKTTLLIGGLSLAASALSYAVIAVIFMNEFKDPESTNTTRLDGAREGLLYGAITGMDIYHFASLFHLYRLLFSALTRDQKEQFFFALEKEISRLKKMTEREFIDFINQNHPDRNRQLGLHPFNVPDDIENAHGQNEILPSPDEAVPQHNIQAPPQAPSSCFRRWCCWFSSYGKENGGPLREEHGQAKDRQRAPMTIM